jgi:hypothetical protein
LGVISNTTTNLVCNQNDSIDLTRIQIGLVSEFLKNHKDTTWLDWLVKIDNDNKIYETDYKGILRIPKRPINQITVRDYSTKFGLDPLVEIKDSVFQISNNANDIRIYIADHSESFIFKPESKMLVKWRKLVSVLPDSLKNLRPDQYIRVKRNCGNIKVE